MWNFDFLRAQLWRTGYYGNISQLVQIHFQVVCSFPMTKCGVAPAMLPANFMAELTVGNSDLNYGAHFFCIKIYIWL